MNTEKFRVPEGKKLNLKKFKTDFTAGYKNKEEAVRDLSANVERLADLQEVLYAQNQNALLIIIQAMDAAGKDSVIEHVMSGINPQGCDVTSFKTPSANELDHDFLWRSMVRIPERGRIGIFNRSYYEEVLIVRVHPEILERQPLPDYIKRDKKIWQKRYADIRNFETYLANNGIHVVKFFLHVSKEEQKNRFLARIDAPEKNWKFSAQDIEERAHWDDYQKAYEKALESTSTDASPWYVIPADHKWFTRVAVSKIICKKLQSLKMNYPKLSDEQLSGLQEAKMRLESEGRNDD
jgi:PPK2 family polyphosphate:nucleotide phosphotransferase